MLNFIDISNWQGDISLPALLPSIDAVVCKATEGVTFVDKYCDKFVQHCITAEKPWGFYHFAGDCGQATEEAQYFVDNCRNYFGHGIPILDWEGNQSVEWVNKFVEHVHIETGVWPWIYANPWRFNQGGVNQNCMRWIAQYPNVAHPSFDDAKKWIKPNADGLVGAWQFCSDGRIDGYSGNLDCNLFYGNKEAWNKYAIGDNASSSGNTGANSSNSSSMPSATLENDEYKITIERK